MQLSHHKKPVIGEEEDFLVKDYCLPSYSTASGQSKGEQTFMLNVNKGNDPLKT